jgi:alpha-ketoglutarate-dependent taurine dioxygenase
MNGYATTVRGERLGVRIETDDLLDLVGDDATLAELQGLLDAHLLLHISPQTEMTPEGFGRLAVHLGMPPTAGAERSPDAPAPLSERYPFIADFSTPGRPPSTRPPRPSSYVRTLHYDGITAYSMQATFDSVESPANLWCDMRAAYRSLPADLRAIVDSHHALHGYIPDQGTALSDFPPLDRARAKRRPLRIRHPRTGEPLLYLPKNPASVIDGLPDDEGGAVLADLWARVESSPDSYRAHAGHNQLFVWDGLGTTHTNPSYPREAARRLWFVIIPSPDPTVVAY